MNAKTSIPSRALALLDDLKMEHFPHLRGSAREHLIGVHDLLSAWGNPPHVCLAGLFHNIYGTEVFKPKAIGLERRMHIAEVIGTEAETLAYLFCVTKRIGFFDKHLDPSRPILWDEVNRTTIVTTAQRVVHLIEIEVANGAEQYALNLPLPSGQLLSILQTARWMREQAADRLSVPAGKVLDDLIASLVQRASASY